MVVSVGKVCSAKYYTQQVATERHDYYAGHGEAAGTWTGSLAGTLGLDGQVDPDAFAAVLAGEDPHSGGKLKRCANRAVLGWDLTFAPPKSFSVLWALAPPDVRAEIRAAHTEAVHAGMGYLERHACVARLGRDGTDRQPATGFVVAAFDHRTSREGDPQLHTHAVVANVVQARDGRRAAPDGALFYRHRYAADAVYQTALRAELTRRLNLTWTLRKDVWEVAGIPAGLCRQFSKRRTQIDHKLAEHGTSGGRAAQAAALDTRKAKPDVAPDGHHLHDRFRAEAADAGWPPDPHLHTALHAEPQAATLDQEVGQMAHPSHVGAEVPTDAQVIDMLVGPAGLTERASSFGRRDVLAKAAELLPVGSDDASGAWARLERIADTVLADARVIPLLAPAGVTSGEVIRRRDPHGKVVEVVCTQAERRYTTADLLAAEHDLLQRATDRRHAGAAVIPDHLVDQVLADHPDLDPHQQDMIATLARSGAGVDVVVGKAGTGKTTALDAYRDLCDRAEVPLIGLAPSATAAHQLGQGAGIADTATVDKLLTDLRSGKQRLPAGVVVVLDEAGMCPTRNRLALQRHVDQVGGKVIDVGDHRQIGPVDVGGGFHALGTTLGATTLGINHRFRDLQYRDAAEFIRDGHPDKAVALLHALGSVAEYERPADAWTAMVIDWYRLSAEGFDVRMYATENAVVDQLNSLARHTLRLAGQLPAKARTYSSADRSEQIELAVGDRVRLGQNLYALPQPDGTATTVRNGMYATVVSTRRTSVTVRLDPDHQHPGGPAKVILPATYVAESTRHGYASTADGTQGATVDHALFTPSAATDAGRAYVALSRGRHTNRIYATRDGGWQHAIAEHRPHTLALHQHPDPHHPTVGRVLGPHKAGRPADPHPTRPSARPDPAALREVVTTTLGERHGRQPSTSVETSVAELDRHTARAAGAERGLESPGIAM